LIKFIIGADEAGRGCIAGHIFASATCFLDIKLMNLKFIDSKKMSKKQRQKQMLDIIDLKKFNIIDFTIAKRSPNDILIDGLGKCNKDIFIESIDKLITNLHNKYGYNIKIEVIVDGNLKLLSIKYPNIIFNSVIKADNKFQEVSLASVIAKSSKDLEMSKLNKEYPNYNFNSHSGYDTKLHRECIIDYGVIKNVHREATKTIQRFLVNQGL